MTKSALDARLRAAEIAITAARAALNNKTDAEISALDRINITIGGETISVTDPGGVTYMPDAHTQSVRLSESNKAIFNVSGSAGRVCPECHGTGRA